MTYPSQPSSPITSALIPSCPAPACISAMANMRNFNGKEDATIWLTDFDVFCAQLAPNITDDQKLQMAQVRLSPEVDGCRQSVAAKMQLVFRAEWIQTWPRVRAILIAVSGKYGGDGGYFVVTYELARLSGQIRLVRDQKSRARTQAVKKGIAITGGGLLVGIAMPIAFLGVMGSISIGAGGAAAGKFSISSFDCVPRLSSAR